MPPFRLIFAAGALALCASTASLASAQATAPAAEPAMHSLPALRYQVLKYGNPTGPHPTRNDTVQVNYEVKLKNGTPVESTFTKGQPAILKLPDLIPAWQAVVPLMRPGDEWRVYVPAEFAYGDSGNGPVPGGADLEFRIQLIAIMPRTH
ncbi:MAG TPA: FKBP-type peptidyl-prolyl cis-trans isomerase [Caulobacteraceae bacterium]|nr:FKBP-type peptidyl-prolyl cis-trans isomerase [Caulobacteraceae bacterium]